MDSCDYYAGAIVEYVGELAAAGGRPGIGDSWNAVRDGIASNTMRLREALTPHGEPVFVQIPAGRRPFQMLVLAAEYWRARGAVTEGESWRVFVACCELAARTVQENETHSRRMTA